MEKLLVNLLRGGFYFLLLSPLFFQRKLLHPFVTLKVVIFQTAVELLAAAYLTLIVFYPQYRPRLTALFLSFSGLILILFITALTGVDWQTSFWSFQERQIGVFALLHFWALFLMLAGLGRQINWSRFFTVSFIVSLLTSGFALVQLAYPYEDVLVKSYSRPGGTLGNPTFLASYLLFHIFIGLWLARRLFLKSRTSGLMIFSGVLLEIGIVFLTETRGALLGLTLGLFLFLIMAGLIYRRFSFLALAGFLFLAGAGFLFTKDVAFWQNIPGLNRFAGSTFSELGVSARINAWKSAWAGIKERPFLGWGWENFDKPFNKYYRPELLRAGFGETFFDKPHNVFMEYLVAGGLLAFVGFLFLAAVYVFDVFQIREDKLLQISLTALLVVYLANNFFVFDTYGSYLMLVVTLAFIDNRTHKPESGDRKLKINKGYAAAALAVLLILAALPIYFVNYRSWYANHQEWQGINYFLNRLPEEAVTAWQTSLLIPNPYRDFIAKEYLSSLQQMHNQGVVIPEIELRSWEALQGLEKAILNRPRHYFFRVAYADAAVTFSQFRQQYLDKAEHQIMKSLEISPRRQQSYYVLAKIKLARGDKEGALKAMGEAVALDAEVGDAHFFNALLAFNTDDFEKGLAELRRAKALGREPKSNHEARVVANYYGDAGHYPEALFYYERALNFNPEDLESLLKKGIVYYYSRDALNARQTFTEFLTRMPDFKNSPGYDKVEPIFKDLGL